MIFQDKSHINQWLKLFLGPPGSRTSPQMFNLASSLLYSSLFNQSNNQGSAQEQVIEGSAQLKPPTYNLGFKAIPDDVIWALRSVHLDQYELPEWAKV